MINKAYLQLLADGAWAKRGMYRTESARTLRFDIKIQDKLGVDYEDLVEKPITAISICASPTISRHGDQCFDKIVQQYRDRVPPEKLDAFDSLYRIWKVYHCNDMVAGTKRQEIFIERIKNIEPKIRYDDLCQLLKNENLLEDAGYTYGHSWLCKPIPKEEIDFLKKICEEWKEAPHD